MVTAGDTLPAAEEQGISNPEGLPMAEEFPELLTVAQAARFLQMTEWQVNRLLNAGALPGRKIGGRWRLSRRQIVEYVEKGQDSESKE